MSKEIIEGNKLIAEFEGWNVDDPESFWKVIEGQTWWHEAEYFNYHEDWNKLISAYSEISRIWVNQSRPKQIKWESFYRAVQNRLCLASQIEMFELIVECVKWYNKQKTHEG